MEAGGKAYALAKEEGLHLWYLGSLVTVKADAESTGGAFGLADETLPPGFQTPYHVHRNEDESFYVIEGEAEFLIDGKLRSAGTGAFVFLPKNVPHGFRIVGASTARVLNLVQPAGFERFFVELGEPASAFELPPPAAPDIPMLIATAKKFAIEILGPLDAFIPE